MVGAIEIILNKKVDVNIIGVRHGEKFHETLVSAEEVQIARDMGDFLEIPMDHRGLDYEKFFEKGQHSTSTLEAITSSNVNALDSETLAAMIKDLPAFSEEMN